MINRNVELREMDLGDVGSTNWSNQTISKGMALKTILYDLVRSCTILYKLEFRPSSNLVKVQVGQDCGQMSQA